MSEENINNIDARHAGRYPHSPIRIFANADPGAFGDFASSLYFINCVAHRFDHAVLTLLYRQDREFKVDMVRLLPAANVIAVPADSSYPSIDIVNPFLPINSDPVFEPWFRSGQAGQDLIITGAMADAKSIRSFEHRAYLRVPDTDAAACGEELVRRGLDPSRWFCTLHCREPGYLAKPTEKNLRDDDPALFLETARHIVGRLGGQIVRLGHPAMTAFPPLEGVIDLSRQSANAMLQAFALSRARFHFGSASGPSAVADTFGTPNALLNAVNYHSDNERAFIRTIDLITPDGKLLRQADLVSAGLHKAKISHLLRTEPGYEVRKIGAAEMVSHAEYMYEVTSDTGGWREPRAPAPYARPNSFTFPLGPAQLGSRFLPVK